MRVYSGRFKLMKWWAQSFLIGIPRIVYGVRGDANELISMNTLDVFKIPSSVRGRVAWVSAWL